MCHRSGKRKHCNATLTSNCIDISGLGIMASVTQGGINLLIWTIVFTALDVLFIILRFWAARIIRRPLYLDDWFILISLASVVALDGAVVWAIFYGKIGHFESDLSVTELQVALQTIPAAYVTWTTGTAAFKMSVLFLYRRVFTINLIKILSAVLMFVTFGYWVSFMVVFLTTCTPDISQLWNPRPDGFCRDLNIGQLGSVSTNLAIDVFVIILPMPFLWNLQMRLRNKIVVTLIFSLGFITIAIMIWRIVDLVVNASADFVRHEPLLALTTTLELWLCIIIGCIPTLGPIGKAYIAPVITKITTRFSAGSTVKTSRSLVTFGRLGGRDHNNYTTMNKSLEQLHDLEAQSTKQKWEAQNYRNDAFTATEITSDMDHETELDVLPPPNAIHVQRRIQTQEGPRV
ncbi:integral membrane protein [Xylaria sp. CBS 124048]|nr:integral membrane protein [Xylaria sp. CBS 124048]